MRAYYSLTTKHSANAVKTPSPLPLGSSFIAEARHVFSSNGKLLVTRKFPTVKNPPPVRGAPDGQLAEASPVEPAGMETDESLCVIWMFCCNASVIAPVI